MGWFGFGSSSTPSTDAAAPSEAVGAAETASTSGVNAAHEMLHEAAPAEALDALKLPTSDRLYNPYEGLGALLDSRRRQEGPVTFRLPQEPEYVFTEEAAVQKRSVTENICFYTGLGYLTGASVGGTRGALTAFRTKPEHGVDTNRLKINRFLNLSGKAGRTAGNGLGVLGLFFAASESGIDKFADGQIPDAMVTILAGATTGALYRSARGPKTAAVAGGVGAVAAGLLVLARKTISAGL